LPDRRGWSSHLTSSHLMASLTLLRCRRRSSMEVTTLSGSRTGLGADERQTDRRQTDCTLHRLSTLLTASDTPVDRGWVHPWLGLGRDSANEVFLGFRSHLSHSPSLPVNIIIVSLDATVKRYSRSGSSRGYGVCVCVCV